jgi:hypothetical protein
MAQGFNRDAEFDRARAEIARLLTSGMLGFYTHFEATEIFAVRDDERVPFNIFSILVAEEHEGDATKEPHFLSDRIRLNKLKGWAFGIQRCMRPIVGLLPAFEHFQRTKEWQPSGKPLRVGPLVPVSTQFAPADSTESAPWNNVLKNNFWSGSHLVEWVDPEKTAVQVLFDDPPRLQELSEAVQRQVPIRLASLSDRLGNVVVQVPGDVLVASFTKAHNGDAIVNVRWHPKATPRPLQASCEMQFDNGANLRALTAGGEYAAGSIPKPTLASLRRQFGEWLRQSFWVPPPQPTFAEKQRAVFQAANSNFRGLRLEYRIRAGSAGWPFHDRFLIFPGNEDGSARAWSLGTSVNSLGKRHHILQEVDDGQLVMDAFNRLWDELDQPEHLVWKVP